VLVDGTEVAASGTLVITGSHTIQAYSDDNLQYTLIVTWGSGVTGTPAAGTYLYKQGAKVPYSFALAEGYTALNVTLDGTAAEASGTLTMSKDYALYAGAQVKYDVRGPWKLTESYDDGSSFEVTATFSGTISGGTVTDSAGGAGTYEFVDATVDFTLAFPDVTYKYSNGSFTDANTMSGSCQRYQDVNNAISGTWSATRASAAVPGTSSRAKGQFRRR
jgi:hypothetical protein